MRTALLCLGLGLALVGCGTDKDDVSSVASEVATSEVVASESVNTEPAGDPNASNATSEESIDTETVELPASEETSEASGETSAVWNPELDKTPEQWFQYYEPRFTENGFYVGNNYDDESDGEDHSRDQFAVSSGVVPVGDFGFRRDENKILIDAFYAYIFKSDADAKKAYDATIERTKAYFDNAPGTQNAKLTEDDTSFTVIDTDGVNFQGMKVGYVGNLMKVFEAHDKASYDKMIPIIEFEE